MWSLMSQTHGNKDYEKIRTMLRRNEKSTDQSEGECYSSKHKSPSTPGQIWGGTRLLNALRKGAEVYRNERTGMVESTGVQTKPKIKHPPGDRTSVP